MRNHPTDHLIGQYPALKAITKVAAHKTVRVGGDVTYTVTVTNLGPGVVFETPYRTS
jgi:hypothetical protein